jgi:low temperature requirement protein LtrA
VTSVGEVGGGVETVVSERQGTSLSVRREGGNSEVTRFELFFDLVFVFAITQLSHLLLEHLSLLGAAQTLLLLLAVWWAWVDTAWVTSWFNPDHHAVRLMLVGVMLVSLVMSAALPEAFGERGLAFAAAYVLIQVGRTAFAVATLAGDRPLRRNFQRILAWMLLSGVFWLAGALTHEWLRGLLWLGAVAIDVVAPALGFYTPGLGRSVVRDWMIAGGHLAERFQLFVIVALGESILVTGATFGETDRSFGPATAAVVGVVGSVAVGWIYFNRSARYGSQIMAAAREPGRLGRSAYTYFHLPMVAGIIVTAVADELTIAHPGGPPNITIAAVALAGPILFLAGHALFKHAVSDWLLTSHLIGIVLLLLLLPLGLVAPPLAVGVAATLVLIGVAAWDMWLAHAHHLT